MIVSHLLGGLGNQMFQYAVGRSRMLTLGTELKLHVADFAGYGLHQGFELDRVFAAPFSLASENDVHSILGWRGCRQCRRLLKKRYFSALRGTRFIVEPGFQYWPDISCIKDASYLMGYWQSEKYFTDIQDAIRSDFVFKGELSGQNAELAQCITKSNAVSLHVRRGDYASNPRTNATHGLCSLDYYRTAICYLAEHIESPEFFIFSDDVPWARNNLNIPFPSTYVDHNKGKESYNDMRLMSLCRHHIIANSSFSWWGAWLNARTDKIVVAPRLWFANGTSTGDLIPDNWLTL
jgi:hypothetical protein